MPDVQKQVTRPEESQDGLLRTQRAMLNIMQDMLETNNALKRAAEEWRATFDAISDSIMVMDKDFRIVRANKATADFLNMPIQEISGNRCFEFIHKTSKPPAFCPLSQAIKNKKFEQAEVHLEERGMWVEVLVDPILDNEKNITGAVHIIRNITSRKLAEQSIRDSEEMLRVSFKGSPIGEIIYDEDGRLIDINFACLGIFGADDPDHMKGINLFDSPNMPDIIKEQLKNGEAIRHEIEYDFDKVTAQKYYKTFKTGVAYIDIIVTPLSLKNKKVGGYLAQLQDITRRRAAEEALRVANEVLESIIDSLPDGTFVIDKDHNVIAWNKAIEASTGISREDIIGKSSADLAHIVYGEEGSIFIDLVGKEESDIKNGYDFVKKIGDTIYAEKFMKMLYGGKGAHVWLSASPIFGPNGERLGAVEMMRDITDRKMYEEEILFKTTILEAESETTLDGILLISDKGEVMLYNKRFIEMWSIPKDLVDIRDDKKLIAHILGQMKEPVEFVRGVEYLYAHKDEKSRDEIEFKDGRFFERYSAPLSGAKGDYYGRIWYFHDITERKTAEESLHKAYTELKKAQDDLIQSEKMSALGRFASGIAHEVKNPLGVVLGGVEFLDKKLSRADEETRIAVEKIKESVLRANNILLDLLEYAKPSEKKFEKMEMGELLRSVGPLLKLRIPSNIEVRIEPSEERINCSVNKNQMHQVMLNVAVNAIEAMPEGGTLTMKARIAQSPDLLAGKPSCVIEIADTGIGISQDDMAKISEPFFTTKLARKGTGLGLFTANAIIAKHKGKITIDSEKGKGTRVKIILPLAENKKEA